MWKWWDRKVLWALGRLAEGPSGEAFLRMAARLGTSEAQENGADSRQRSTGSLQPHLERLSQALEARLGLCPEDLHALLRIGDTEAREQLASSVLERLIRHYEVRKGLRIAGATRSRYMLSLASFANYLCDEYRRSGDLRTLNTALKVNESLYKRLRWWSRSGDSAEAQEIRRLASRSFVAQEQLLGALDRA